MRDRILHIEQKHFEVTKSILKKNNLDGIHVWLFGSRVSNKAKPYSDLDIALENKNKKNIPLKVIASIKADFDESDLPWKVDVIDYNSISGIFKQNIDTSKISLNLD